MSRINVGTPDHPLTHEGAPARRIDAEAELRRSVMSCLLWEDSFYESGIEIAERIKSLIPKLDAKTVGELAREARLVMHLRHVPLLLVREMARHFHGKVVADTIEAVIQRADELAELLALYWKEGKRPLSAQMKRGLARAFCKFSEYELAKYNRDNPVKLRDTLFLCHAKPKDDAQTELWKRLIDGTLKTPDTWEVALSAGKDKRETWIRLMAEKKLGGLALLRNLRNMTEANVPVAAMAEAIATNDFRRVLPFRFIAAARACPGMEPNLDEAMLSMLAKQDKVPGKTILVIDISGSMDCHLSEKSDMTRIDVACALGAIMRELCEEPRIYATSGDDSTRLHATALIPVRRGMALVDAIRGMRYILGGGGIFLNPVMKWIKEREKDADRIVVITDEQDCAVSLEDSPIHADAFGKQNYLINVQANQNGIGYGKWTHIDGFSENVIRYILEAEKKVFTQNEK